MNAQTVRLSPLHSQHLTAGATLNLVQGWQVATAMGTSADEAAAARASLGIADLSDRTKVVVEGQQAGAVIQSASGGSELAVNQGSFLSDADLHVYALRRDRFYLSAAAGREAEIIEKLNGAIAQIGELVTVTDETDARSEFLLVGPEAATCLSRVCGLDFHADEFPNLTGKQTSVAKIRQLIMRRDMGDLPAYVISGGRSYALYLWETLVQAGRDLDIQSMGRDAVDTLYSSDSLR